MKQIGIRVFAVALLFISTQVFAATGGAGAVYTTTNDPAGNRVLIFDRATDGSLTADGSVATGGLGTGIGLGNQSGIAISNNGAFLLVVNAGSNEISSFTIDPHGLTLADRIWSGGTQPTSVTTYGSFVYVLNSDNIAGFTIAGDGTLSPIAGSTLPLSQIGANPAQIGFNAEGTVLVVTEKATSRIDTYTVDASGIAHGPNVFASVGSTPFGFNFGKRNQLFVTEAGASATSSYSLSSTGELTPIGSSVLDNQAAACWLVTSIDGRYAYVGHGANDPAISGYSIAPDGTIALLNADGVTGTAAGSAVDEALSANGRYLYTLTPSTGAIGAFAVAADGSLAKVGDFAIPVNTNGLAAR